MQTPTMDDIRRISLINDPVLRNVLITQCYFELSQVIKSRTGPVANWCTFATWASKQAGQSIRKEDLQRVLESRVDIELLKEFQALLAVAKEMGIGPSLRARLHTLVKNSLFNTVVDRTSEAIALGNKSIRRNRS